MVNDARVLQQVLNAVLCSTGSSSRAFFGKRREENFFVLNFYKKFGVIYNRNGEREREKTADLEADAVSERDGIEDIEQKLLLDTILQKLPIEQRETVILRFREEMGFRDIARILGCSLSTAKSRCRLGVRRMRKEIEAYERK